eukprot:6576887-Prymnesium_polylepis.1
MRAGAERDEEVMHAGRWGANIRRGGCTRLATDPRSARCRRRCNCRRCGCRGGGGVGVIHLALHLVQRCEPGGLGLWRSDIGHDRHAVLLVWRGRPTEDQGEPSLTVAVARTQPLGEDGGK